MPAALNSLKTRKTLKVGTRSYDYFSLKAAEKTLGDLKTLPHFQGEGEFVIDEELSS